MDHNPLLPSGPQQRRTTPPDNAGTRAKILVAECNPATAEMTALVLAHVGYRALQAMTGQQALAAVRLWEPDLVLLDLALPDLPGTQVCRQLRQLSPVPIMIVSTETDPGTIDLAMAAGASDYVRKPFRTVDLLARMELHLSTPRRPDGIARDRDPSRVAHPSP